MLQEFLIKRAMDIASKSEYKFRVGALLLRNKTVVKEAYNDNRFVGFMNGYYEYPTLHAEIAVMKNILKEDLSKCSILVVRINQDNELACAKPCEGCRKYAFSRGIKKVHYSDKNGKIITWRNYYK